MSGCLTWVGDHGLLTLALIIVVSAEVRSILRLLKRSAPSEAVAREEEAQP